MTYTITNNASFNSIEISFTTKPTEDIRNALKALRFRWHSVKKVWYGYSTEEAVKAALEGKHSKQETATETAVNIYGVKVGDIFEATWGWEQTNVDFFQVVALVGKTSVRVRQVFVPLENEEATGPMSANRTYRTTNELLPATPHSVFIKDQENGDVKRLKPGYYQDEQQARDNCYFKLDSFANAHKVNSETVTTYESWYA